MFLALQKTFTTLLFSFFTNFQSGFLNQSHFLKPTYFNSPRELIKFFDTVKVDDFSEIEKYQQFLVLKQDLLIFDKDYHKEWKIFYTDLAIGSLFIVLSSLAIKENDLEELASLDSQDSRDRLFKLFRFFTGIFTIMTVIKNYPSSSRLKSVLKNFIERYHSLNPKHAIS